MESLSVGQCVVSVGLEYVINEVSLINGKLSYSLLGLSHPTISQAIAAESMRFYRSSAKVLTLDELRTRRAEVQRLIREQEAEKLAAKKQHEADDASVRIDPENAGLLTVETERNTTKLAAKNCRILLKKHFPGIKFSVRMRDYNCININWMDGPTKDAVEAITARFKEGSFDGMQDMYESTITSFNRVYGGVKFLFPERTYSDELIGEAILALRKERGETVVPLSVTIEQFRKGALYAQGLEYFSHGLQSGLWKKLSEIDKCSNK
ncbi:LPD29 domain-containing protein [Dickeya sp. NCPPB 3274]|uniref:LPD29 domain-containing protein n=1 Tax=Dickeya sp. NCPPB 3274 TaxID=568766 RepID=UPI0003A6FF61|nr:LPD29 domain-containing protein [Dickeya sp. NCPPB 3274]